MGHAGAWMTCESHCLNTGSSLQPWVHEAPGPVHLLVEAILLFKEFAVWENFIKVVCVKASIYPLHLLLCDFCDSGGRIGTYSLKSGFLGACVGQSNPLQKLSAWAALLL